MTSRPLAVQEDLFESSEVPELRRRVRELDKLILRALKHDNYERAKELTEQQKSIIQELVNLGDKEMKK